MLISGLLVYNGQLAKQNEQLERYQETLDGLELALENLSIDNTNIIHDNETIKVYDNETIEETHTYWYSHTDNHIRVDNEFNPNFNPLNNITIEDDETFNVTENIDNSNNYNLEHYDNDTYYNETNHYNNQTYDNDTYNNEQNGIYNQNNME